MWWRRLASNVQLEIHLIHIFLTGLGMQDGEQASRLVREWLTERPYFSCQKRYNSTRSEKRSYRYEFWTNKDLHLISNSVRHTLRPGLNGKSKSKKQNSKKNKIKIVIWLVLNKHTSIKKNWGSGRWSPERACFIENQKSKWGVRNKGSVLVLCAQVAERLLGFSRRGHRGTWTAVPCPATRISVKASGLPWHIVLSCT